MSDPARTGVARTRDAGPSAWYLAPALAVFLLFAVAPLVVALWLSFTTWNGISPPEFVRLSNWRAVLSDPTTWHSLRLSIEVVVLSWLFQTPISLLLGTFVAGKHRYRAALARFGCHDAATVAHATEHGLYGIAALAGLVAARRVA